MGKIASQKSLDEKEHPKIRRRFHFNKKSNFVMTENLLTLTSETN